MTTAVPSVILLLLLAIGSVQALLGQTLSSSHLRSFGFFQHVGAQSRFPENADKSRARLSPRPDAQHLPPAATFLSATQLVLDGSTVYPVVSGDLNGDQLPDVVTLTQDPDSPTGIYLLALLNAGNAVFADPVLTPVSFATGDFIISSDINKDGKTDIVLVHPNSMDVLISMGDGTFSAPQSFTTGISSPVAAAFWDVNHDHIMDVVVVDSQSNQAAYLLGDGQGNFGPPQMTSFPGRVTIGVLADVDADGNLDLVTNNTLYLGDGNGGFLVGNAFQSNDGENAGAVSSNSVAVGDLNGDGLLDVVTANGNWNTVSVFLNQGGHNLVQHGASFWSGNNPAGLAVADMNWDGKQDLVVTNAAESDLSVFLGKGDGTFLAPTTEYAIGGSPTTGAVLADFNGDGDLDAVFPDNQSSVVLALGNGDGTFQAAATTNIAVPAGSSQSGGAISIASADFNGDGVPDFVVGQSSTSPGRGLVVFLTQSAGTLGKGVVYAQNDALSYVAVGDINRDGKADIVASNWASGGVDVLLGKGDGTFQAAISISLPGLTNGVVVADLNGDGWPDVAVAGANSVVYVLLNNGAGSLTLAGTYPISAPGTELIAADINNDGKLDLCITMASTSRAAVLLGNGNGTFSAAPDFDTGQSSVYGIAAGDLDGDGLLDLVVSSPSDGSIAVGIGNGDGTFNSPDVYAVSSLPSQLNPSPGEVALSDVNEDGALDIVYANSGYSSVGYLLGGGAGNFYGPSEFPAFPVGGGSLALVVADLNKDGWPDVVTADAHFSGVSILYNTTASQPSPNFAVTANPAAVSVTAGGMATATIALQSSNGFVGSVQLSCANLPNNLSCSFNPSTVHVIKGAVVSSQLTIRATQSELRAKGFGSGKEILALALMPLLGGVFSCRGRRAIRKLALLTILATLLLLIGCQGLTPSKSTTGQTYTITVGANAWDGISHSVQINITVQQ